MNDPRITAYALGELTGYERDEFERELAGSEDLQRELNETIKIADALGNLPMPTDSLSDQERDALRKECAGNLKTSRRKFPVWRIVAEVAAVLAVIGFLASLSLPAITGSLQKAQMRRPLSESSPVVAQAPMPPVESSDLNYAPAPAETPFSEPVAESRAIAMQTPVNKDPSQALGADLPAKVQEKGEATQFLAKTDPELARKIMAAQPEDLEPAQAMLANSMLSAPPAPSAMTLDQTQVTLQEGSSVPEKERSRLAAKPIDAPPAPAFDGSRTATGSGGGSSAGLSVAASTAPNTLTAGADAARGSYRLSGEGAPSGGLPARHANDSRFADGDQSNAADKVPVAGDIPLAGRLFRSEKDAKKVGSGREFNTEAYDTIQENVFLTAKENPLSTFSIDVDTASYANVRRFLQTEVVPPAGAIRTEELINYFKYDYQQPEGESPFSVNLEVSTAPWDAKRELVRIGLKGRELPESERGPANLVFLVDVSGSMDQPDKLPLLKRSLSALVENLSPKDRVAIVVYAGSSGLVLPSTPGTEKSRILEALDDLKAGGSTNGGAGIRLAYKIARENLVKGGNNRVILCTDGDFNVGTTNQSELVRLIEKERASGVFLSVLGFGTGNIKDSTMEKLADKGNGNYSYIDSLTEGRKVLVEEMGATLFTIAKDVKIQVEFNPARVAGYRLIGYENRLLAKEDFNNDKKDAGEIGAGHTVTALYEIIPAGQPLPDQPSVDPLKYQKPEASAAAAAETGASELLTVKLRYKAPEGDKSRLLEVPLAAPEIPAFEKASSDFQFAAGVAAFGMKLRGSPTAGDIGWSDIQKIVRRNLGEDPGSYRAEFLTLIEKAARLTSTGNDKDE